ncbi:hypothetical protein L208DRAFT_1390593 [Tricholoma matsutake]|nr:hypothetical protein L208DRAFT_1390593 [Tricholoma matsutake 945]
MLTLECCLLVFSPVSPLCGFMQPCVFPVPAKTYSAVYRGISSQVLRFGNENFNFAGLRISQSFLQVPSAFCTIAELDKLRILSSVLTTNARIFNGAVCLKES